MFLSQEAVRRHFDKKLYKKGRECFLLGQVEDMRLRKTQDDIVEATCTVNSLQPGTVTITAGPASSRYSCSCPEFRSQYCCAHIVAAYLALSEIDSDEIETLSDANAQALLDAYRKKSAGRPGRPDEKARLVPRLAEFTRHQEFPKFSFQVGFEKLYVVKDIEAFLKNVNEKKTTSYGKNLTLSHEISQFDGRSQRLIGLLMDQYDTCQAIEARARENYYSVYSHLWGRNKNEIELTGSAFDRLFDLIQDEPLAVARSSETLTLAEEDPKVTLSIEKAGRAARLVISTPDDPGRFFSTSRHLYSVNQSRLCRTSSTFRERVYPLLSGHAGDMTMAYNDLAVFCSVVLPEIQDLVEITDEENLLTTYLPDECTAQFYFDVEDDALILKLVFAYGDTSYNAFSKPPQTIRQNLRQEQEARALAEEYFETGRGRYFLSGEDAYIPFLLDTIPRFRETGEVYLSTRLRSQQFKPERANVGVSVSDGILSLDIDTGGFPADELEALYQSLLKRRRYYRLKDGRYMGLGGGSSCETMAETAHMLQLSAGDLSGKKKIQMPAFRALYLDEMLSGSEDISFKRDQQFRAMIRNFKSVNESDYTVPDTMEDVLRGYQKTGFKWLKTLESCGFGGILADEMGLGKTIQVIAWLMTAPRALTGKTSLIVCPASLILNWMDELARFAPALKALAVMGTAAERRRLLSDGADQDIWVTSYELLRQDIEQYAPLSFYCCVLDEGQHIKNQSTLASKAVKRIDCRQRFVLTGTPIENRLSELWNLFDFLMPGYLFSHRAFMEKLEKPVVKSGDAGAAAQLKKLVQPFMLRRLKKDVLKELPPKTEHVRRIALSGAERKVYLASAAAARKKLLSGQGDGGKIAVLAALTQLRQICCAPDLCFENYEGPQSKLDACIELCAGMTENGHQILLFSQFTSMLDMIRPRLDALHIRNFTLQGSTPKEKRAQLVRDFNAGKADVFLISLKAGGTGLNLTAADIVIHYDPWWNVAAQDQATDRTHRIGQLANVEVYKFIAEDTIEEKILELQTRKAALMDAVSDDTGTSILTMSREELLELFNDQPLKETP